MIHVETIEVAAPASTVWPLIADVPGWSRWTASIRSADWLDGAAGPAVGARARVSQPKLPTAVWTVTDVDPGRAFTWASPAPGFRTVASHRVEDTGAGSSRVTLRIEQTGPIGVVVGAIYARLTRRYVRMEAEGLRAVAEATG